MKNFVAMSICPDGRSGNRLLHALAEIVKEDVVAEWLETPSEVLDGLKPLELIERGEVDRIWQIISALRSGGPT